MEISSRHYSGKSFIPASIIEITVTDGGSTITSDVTDLKGRVDESLIADLREIADELEEQNRLVDEKEARKEAKND